MTNTARSVAPGQRLPVLLPALVALAVCLTVAACGSDIQPRDGDVADLGDDLGPDTEMPVPDAFCRVPAPPRPTSPLRLEPVFTHAFPEDDDASRITQLVPSPFTPGEWYAVKHKGYLIRFSEDPAQPGHEIVLDLRDGRVSLENDEAGIVSLAFHPAGTHAFLAYQAPTQNNAFFDSVISRFDVLPDGTLDPDSEVELVRLPQPNFPHSVDQVAFGPDGMLYATFGDGGTRTSEVRAQDPTNLYGTMIRVDVDGTDPVRGTPYAIPADNPFADGAHGAPEVFAWGLRNTWRFSFDRETGDIWGGDVGQNRLEEVNRIVRGGNYGWPVVEGTLCYREETCDPSPFLPPIHAYPRSEGISVTGGYVYRGSALPGLRGRYVYADYLFGTVWSIDAQSAPGFADPRIEAQSGFWISSFAEAPDGELYLVRWSQAEHIEKTGTGGIYKLVPAEDEVGPDAFPTLLSQTGCQSDDDITAPAEGLVEFAPSAALWSDGADKLRYLSLPEPGTVEVDGEGNLLFPPGTVLVKHFKYGERLHETRLLIHHPSDGWRGYTYRWRPDQSDAELLEAGYDETLPDGHEWRYPSRPECSRCHTAAAAHTLGLEVGQLAAPLPGESSSQLESWLAAGLFSESVSRETFDAFEPYVAVDDSMASAQLRARSYLHSNCSNCHRPGGPVQTEMDLRFATPLVDMNVCDALPLNGTLGLADAEHLRLIVPGDPEASILYLRMTRRGEHQMPPLGTHLVDEPAAEVVRTWIEELEGCP